MKKKIMCILFCTVFIISVVPIVESANKYVQMENSDQILQSYKKIEKVSFSERVKLTREEGYLKLEFEDANAWLLKEGFPELPIYITTYVLPDSTRNIRVECTPNDIQSMSISGEIIPASIDIYDADHIPVSELTQSQRWMGEEVYPDSWFSYHVGCGLQNGIRVTFLKIICHVVRYAPKDNMIEYVRGMDIHISYDLGEPTTTFLDEYDMVIITPEAFSSAFQPLLDHKEQMGMKTRLKTVEAILQEYDGYDAPEQIKYFIKDAIEMWNITYVLLGGGLKSHMYANDKENCNTGTRAWHVPARYTNVKYGGDEGCLSDLYYADIYEEDYKFSSWDSNGNRIYGEHASVGESRDRLDLYPDVYVGRLACRNKYEMSIMVNKIITYEGSGPDAKPWFRKIIAIAGKTHEMYYGIPDGEYVTNNIIANMSTYVDEVVKVYASNRNTEDPVPIPEDIQNAISDGAGFATFMGHGQPFTWDTHWIEGKWTGGLQLPQILGLINREKLPVIVIGGCHQGLFNVTLLKTINTRLPTNYYWTYGLPAPVCFSWGLCLLPWGGAIASTGCTGLGVGWGGRPISLSSEMEVNFFYMIGQQNAEFLSQAHGDAISKFINENSIMHVETHCITIFELFGDPSLKLGGYA